MVVRQGMCLALVGVAIGLGAAFGLARVHRDVPVRRDRNGIRSSSSASRSCSTLVALLAVWLPARRASRVDPIIALRYE